MQKSEELLVVCCGEAIIDLISSDGIHYVAQVGGSAFNAALAGARLGARFGILSRTSSDSFGIRIRSELARNNVDLSLIVPATEPTSLAIASIGADGDATYNFYIDGTADWQWSQSELDQPWSKDPKALLIGSMSLEVTGGGRRIADLARRTYGGGAVTVCYDPNVRLLPGEAGARLAESILPWTDIVKVSVDDLFKLYPNENPAVVAQRWVLAGPQWVFLTQGERGVQLFQSDGRSQHVQTGAVSVCDTVGAGDTFCAAMLVALADRGLLGLRSRDLRTAVSDSDMKKIMTFACTAAAATCEKKGADPPTKAEVHARL